MTQFDTPSSSPFTAGPGGPPATERGGNVPELSVSDLSMALKRTVEQAFDRVRVRGEISGLKRAASGHMYMALKDADAVMDGVMWRGRAGTVRFRPEDGMEIIATGKLTTYPGRSKYQIVIEHMEPAGVGALMAVLEKRKATLAAEGLFDASRKRPLPFLPRTIGVITSPTGAVIRDILHRLSDRCPSHVLLWPVLVQGEEAAAQITNAITGFNALPTNGTVPRPDVLIVARGGGSIEDLWAFNEENVVRATANSAIPLISAVGHETDTTLIDHASDRRAPTPTAAAEFCVPVLSDLVYTLQDLDRRLIGATGRQHSHHKTRLEGLARGLRNPAEILAMKTQRLDDVSSRLVHAPRTTQERARARLQESAASLRPRLLQADISHKQTRLSQSYAQMQRRAQHLTERHNQELTHLSEALMSALNTTITEAEHALSLQSRVLESVGYTSVLKRGFAVVRTPTGEPVTQATEMTAGAPYAIEFADGIQTVTAEHGADPKPATQKAHKKPHKPTSSAPKTAKTRTAGTSTTTQGNLFE